MTFNHRSGTSRAKVGYLVFLAVLAQSCSATCPSLPCVSTIVVAFPSDVALEEPQQLHLCLNDNCIDVAWPHDGTCEMVQRPQLMVTLCNWENIEAQVSIYEVDPKDGDGLQVVVLDATGDMVLAESRELSYHVRDVNGADCPGSCQAAEVNL
jgi:hypothetical protein